MLSETCAFDLVDAEFIRDIKPGEMLILVKIKEPESIQLFEPKYRPCAFEYVYFARPDSVIDGKMFIKQEKIWKNILAKMIKISK